MRLRAALLGLLALPWHVHGAVVLLSALGTRPLASPIAASALLSSAVLVAAGIAFYATAAVDNTPMSDSPVSRMRLRGAPAVATTSLAWAAAIVFALSALLALVLPVIAYDALWYRLPTIAQWLDAGRVAWVVSDDPVRNGYPLGQEAVSAVVVAATGSMRFADVTSLIYVACGALAIWLLAETCGVRRAFARAAAALFVLVPMQILNASSGYVDAAFAGATVALLCTSALLATERSVVWALAAGMSAAHVLALKGNGVGFVALAVVTVVAYAIWRARTTAHGAPAPAALHAWLCAGIALACAAPGSYWLVRNVVHTGNPLWPVEISWAGHPVLPGVGSLADILDVVHNTPAEFTTLSEAQRVLRTWTEWQGPAVTFDDRLGGLGFAWPLCALPAIAACALRALRARERPRAALLLVIALTAACFALQPMRWWSRYTLWLWGAGALAIAFEAERLLAAGRTRLLACALTAVACISIGEAATVLAHTKGAVVSLQRWPTRNEPDLTSFSDPRIGLNALYWVPPEFWHLGVDRDRDICRGAWKPETDDAILDGVFAQLTPRPRVHIIDDDDGDWQRVRAMVRAAGCGQLLLLKGSPVLAQATRDGAVAVEEAMAFDPLYVVRAR